MSTIFFTFLEYSALAALVIVVSNYLVDAYQALKKKSEIQHIDDTEPECIVPITITPPKPPPPKLYSIYPPTVFSKYITRQFYVYMTFKSFAFFENRWMKTLAEILSLLECADESTVVKKGSKSIKMVIGTRGSTNTKIGEAYEAYYICDLSIKIAERFAHLHEDRNYLKEITLAILLMHIDEIEEIHHWIQEETCDDVRAEISRYLLRDLSDEERNAVLYFINIIHSEKFDNGVLTALASVINAVKGEMKITSKVISKDLTVDSWDHNFHTKNLLQQSISMHEIERF